MGYLKKQLKKIINSIEWYRDDYGDLIAHKDQIIDILKKYLPNDIELNIEDSVSKQCGHSYKDCTNFYGDVVARQCEYCGKIEDY